MKEKTCCFTGHRTIPPAILPKLSAELESTLLLLIQRGFRYFGAGGALGFDTLCAETVLRLKAQFPHIRLILVLPYLNGAMPAEGYDETVYPPLESVPPAIRYFAQKRMDDSALRRACRLCHPRLGRGGQDAGVCAQKEKDHSRIRRMTLGEKQARRSSLCLLLFFFFACPHCAVYRPNRKMRPEGKGGVRRSCVQNVRIRTQRVILQLRRIRANMSHADRQNLFSKDKEVSFMETNTARNRLDDMLERYGEVCTQKVAAQLLSVVPRTIHRMLEEGRLRRVDRRVDVRSICEYIENPKQANFVAKAKNTRPRNTMSESDFFAAAQQGRWAPRR